MQLNCTRTKSPCILHIRNITSKKETTNWNIYFETRTNLGLDEYTKWCGFELCVYNAIRRICENRGRRSGHIWLIKLRHGFCKMRIKEKNYRNFSTHNFFLLCFCFELLLFCHVHCVCVYCKCIISVHFFIGFWSWKPFIKNLPQPHNNNNNRKQKQKRSICQSIKNFNNQIRMRYWQPTTRNHKRNRQTKLKHFYHHISWV